jgi:hypothetical protein
LQVGITVRGYYRKEIGRLVLRELRWGPWRARGKAAKANEKSFEIAPVK